MAEPIESSDGNFITQKYGPLPGWAWVLITVLVVYLYLRYRQNKTASTTTTTGTGTSTGTSNALTSNLVGVEQPVPVLDGTYQVQVTPENSPSSINSTTANNSTQGVATSSPPSGSLTGTDQANNAAQTTNVQPQTQPSSPQTQTGPVG